MSFEQKSNISLNHETPENTITTDNKCIIRTQIEMQYITVSVDEWTNLETNINEISIEKPIFLDFVSLFIGTGLTSFVTIIFDIFKHNYSNLTENTICLIISVCIAAIINFCKSKKNNNCKHYHENNTYLKVIKKDLARLKNKC